MIGVIGAMDEEVTQIKEKMRDTHVRYFAGMDFYTGVILNQEITVVRSGIGKVNAALCSQALVDNFKVKVVLNTGIAGSLRNEINIGDIVLSTDALQHDMDATAFGYEPGQIPRMETLAFPADQKLLQLAYGCSNRVNSDITTYQGRVVSGDQFISDRKTKQRLVDTFNGFCCEMEGAAIAQAAFLNKVPFLIIRAISDKADDSAKEDYPVFEAKAITHSVNLLLEMIGNMETVDI